MNLEWLHDDDNIECNGNQSTLASNHCEHFRASFISSQQDDSKIEINNPYTAVECADNLEQIFQAIKQKQLDKVKEIVNLHKLRCQNLGGGPDFKWDIINDSSKNWSPLHHSVYYGCEKIFLWFISMGGDIQSITYDGYSCLILAVSTANTSMVSLLIAQKNLNINHISRKGSALHIAVIDNQINILKILLKHPLINLNIYNDQQKQPIDLASGKTKNILQRELQLRAEVQQIQLMSSFISSIKLMNSFTSQNTFEANSPKKPPIFKGFVQKLHYTRLYMYQRYIIVDPDSGVLARYEDLTKIPLDPKEIIPLWDVNNLQIQKQTWFSKQEFTYLLVEYAKRKLYFAFSSETIAKIWQESIRLATGYAKYVKYKLEQYNFTKEENKLYSTVISLLLENANQQVEIRDSYQPPMQDLQIESNYQKTSDKEDKFSSLLKFKQFKILDIIGKGSFGFVFKAIYLSNSKIYALKQENKEQLKRKSQYDYAINEVKLMTKLNHPLIIEIIGAFQTMKNLYYIMEYHEKGDLSQYIGKGVILSEHIAKFLIAQIILAIEHIHKFDIIYRDLKPQNILVANDGFLKLVDLGLAKQIENDRSAFSFCGSPAYLAPETIKGNGVNKAVDIYGVGLLLYEMLSGYPPHYTSNMEDLINRIQYCPVNYDCINSPSAIKLLNLILNKDSKARPSLKEIKQHIFFADIDWGKMFEKSVIPIKIVKVNQQLSIVLNTFENQTDDEDYKNDVEMVNFVSDWDFY